MAKLNKDSIVECLVQQNDKLTKNHAKDLVEQIFTFISDEMQKGNTVYIPGFGSFLCVESAARNGINPQTREAIQIPARKSPKLKPSADFKKKCFN